MTATQCAQPAAAFTIEVSIGRGKGAGVSLKVKIRKELSSFSKEMIENINEIIVFCSNPLPHASRMSHSFDLGHLLNPM